MKSKQLTFARQYRGYTQTELAKAVDGLSQSNLSKFEKGLGSLSDSVLNRIMELLRFPIEFLDLDIDNTVVCKHYRKKASIRVSDRDRIDRFVALCAYCFDWMTDEVEIPEFKFKYMDLDNGITPEEAALYVRKQFRLGLKPIENICNLLESNGVSLFFCISAFLMMYTTQKGVPEHYILKRLIRIVPLYWIMTVFTFAAMRIIPSISTGGGVRLNLSNRYFSYHMCVML